MASNVTLTRLSGFDRNKKTAFTADRVSLGTDSGSDLRFDPTWDKTVAARHLTLEWRGGELWAVDASKDGTFVGGKKISAEKLSPGAVLELGKGGPKVQVDFTAEARPSPAAAAPRPVAEPPLMPAPAARPVPAAAASGVPGWVFGLIGAVVVLGAIAAFVALRPKTDAGAKGKSDPASITQTSGKWEPVVLFDGQIFPAYLIASATVDPAKLPSSGKANRLGDPAGVIGVNITSPENNAPVTVTFEATTIFQRSSVTVTLPEKDRTYLVCPKMNYNFEALLRTRQAVPITLAADVAFGSQPAETRAITVRLSPINDCPFALAGAATDNKVEWIDWMFAAYVNENHPWSDDLRKEALKSGLIDNFAGYQGSPEDVITQVFAIWHVLQKRGFKYSNITTTTGKDSEAVGVQQVRFLDQAVAGAQANCVDGSVLFASVLRQIGIEPVLVLVPGHMFMGFYLSPGSPESIIYLETTMMGNVNLSPAQSLHGLPKIMSSLDKVVQSKDPKVLTSYKSFQDAVQTGNTEARKYQDDFEKPGSRAKKISVQGARNMGVLPIAYQP